MSARLLILGRIFAIACRAVVMLACGGGTMAAPVRLAVPFSVDRVQTPSGMAIEVEAEDLTGRTLIQLAQSPLGPLLAFSELIGHLSAGRVPEAAAMLRPQAFQASDDATKYAQNMSVAFKEGWPALVPQRRYDLGPESWITWEIALGGQPVRRMSRFAESNGRWMWSDELQSSAVRTVQTVITASEQLVASGHPQARKVEGMEFMHRGVVPSTKASWLFNGFSCTWDAFGPAAPPDHPVTLVYGKVAKALHAGDVLGYAGYFTEFSSQRFKEAISKMDDPQKAAYFDSIRQLGRRVTFVLDASPLFIVFYETTGRGMLYDTLFAPEGDLSKLRLCNFMVETFIDDIFKDQGYFQDPVIRPIAGRPEDPPKIAVATHPIGVPPARPNATAPSSPASPPSAPASPPQASPDPLGAPSPVLPPAQQDPSRFPIWVWFLLGALLIILFRKLRSRP